MDPRSIRALAAALDRYLAWQERKEQLAEKRLRRKKKPAKPEETEPLVLTTDTKGNP